MKGRHKKATLAILIMEGRGTDSMSFDERKYTR
jgi:hypothetical protein